MKKRLISLVAAAALVGGISIAQAPAAKAGTVTVAGDTQVQLYGGVKIYTGWTKQLDSYGNVGNKVWADNAMATDKAVDYQKLNKTNFQDFSMSSAGTKLGVNFSNKDANISGKIEIGLNAGGNYLRHAYIKHSFNNGLYVLLGQTSVPYEQHSFSIAPNVTAGWNILSSRTPEVMVGGNLDIADSASLDFKFAAFTPGLWTPNAPDATKKMPAFGLDLGVNFDTGFGAPARVYAATLVSTQKYTYYDNVTSKYNATNKTSYAYTAGLVLPVSMVTFQTQYQHAKGMSKLAGVKGAGAEGVAPDVYINKNENGITQSKFDAWNIEAKVAPMPCVSVALGYDYIKFKNLTDQPNTYTGFLKKNSAYFINANIKTTKYTTLGLEWQHDSTKYDKQKDSKAKGDLFYAQYTYSF
ncbi:hypothetical protein [Hippea jasoniae]|uniref:hypothetical protein n=1 Tax=Hippea jasoniae TaxID=944479 RepID=UPI00054E3322|nr:hypothetical protein [Hippea jasoniae]